MEFSVKVNVIAIKTVFLFSLVCNSALSDVRKIDNDTRIGLENSRVRVEFSRETGALVRLFNRQTAGDYFKTDTSGDNPFRVFLDSTEPPSFLNNERVQPLQQNLGGHVVVAGDCRLTEYEFTQDAEMTSLKLISRCEAVGLCFEFIADLGQNDDAVCMRLTVANESSRPSKIMTVFPYFSGLGLGGSPQTNLGVRLHVFGQSRGKAWAESGDIYGRHWASQWNSVYEPSTNEALGIVVEDKSLQNKAILRHPGGIMEVFYFDNNGLASGEKIAFPRTRVLVYKGDWKPTAVEYGKWFRGSFKLRKAPQWLKETNMFIGAWIPAPENKEGVFIDRAISPLPYEFKSFEDLPRIFLQPDMTWETCGKYDLKEFAQYWEGVNRHKIYGAYQHTDGIYDFRKDLGGVDIFNKGVIGVEKIGRHVGLYVASRTVRNDSDFFKAPNPGAGTDIRDWLWMNTPDTKLPPPEKNGHQSFFMSPRNPQWQDYLAGVVKKLIKQTGAKYVRLDEFWSTFVVDHNPKYITDPYNGTPEVMEFLRKIRSAIDEVDPDVALFTEGATDITAQYVDGTLCMFACGQDIDPMRLVIPEFIGFSYHLGQIDCALQGYVCACEYAANRQYAWWTAHSDGLCGPGLEKKPSGYPDPPQSEIWGVWPQRKSRWFELQYTFKDAARGNDPVLDNPIAVDIKDAEIWSGRIWKSPKYWLLVCGSRWGQPFEKTVKVKLPELPEDIEYAVEFDTETLEMRETVLERTSDGIYVDTHYGFSAVLLPRPECPPIVEISESDLNIPVTGSKTLVLKAFAPWNSQKAQFAVSCEVPGLEVKNGHGLKLPGAIKVLPEENTEKGFYYLKVAGECLPLKRWFKID
jgi:hypothetical protein